MLRRMHSRSPFSHGAQSSHVCRHPPRRPSINWGSLSHLPAAASALRKQQQAWYVRAAHSRRRTCERCKAQLKSQQSHVPPPFLHERQLGLACACAEPLVAAGYAYTLALVVVVSLHMKQHMSRAPTCSRLSGPCMQLQSPAGHTPFHMACCGSTAGTSSCSSSCSSSCNLGAHYCQQRQQRRRVGHVQ
jgi:hypothetical protein